MSTFHLPLKRQPPPPLLRPPRRSARLVLISLALGAVGLAGGLTLGLGLRPRPPVPTASLPAAPGPPPPISAAPSDTAAAGDLAGLRAARRPRRPGWRAWRPPAWRPRRIGRAAPRARRRPARAAAAARRALAPGQRQRAAAGAGRPAPALAAPVLRPPRAEMASAAGQPRIFIHLRAGSPAAAEAAASLAAPCARPASSWATCGRCPAPLAARRPVLPLGGCGGGGPPRRPPRPRLGDPGFPQLRALPAAQTLEIWLPDR
ncbi:hypothetical protein ACFQY5_28455 [Paeniroseomonas aquatica]|uniref:hypothetical protein n=1 Tax=Paeniroseomonas aquatica TaxID=373043 RepID=UPI003610D2A7